MPIARYLAAAIFLIMSSPAQSRVSEPESEYKLKAAFLYNFAKFVDWPDESSPVLEICIAGHDPFGSNLEDTVGGHAINGRSIVIRRLVALERIRQCDVVFISSSEKSRIAQVLASLGGAHVLTVAEIPGFAAAGGMIGFVVDQDNLRFDINAGAAERAGLKVSSRLLRLANSVIGGTGRGR